MPLRLPGARPGAGESGATLRVLVGLAAVWLFWGTGSASWAQGGAVTFSVTGDIPYSDGDADRFRVFVDDHNLMSPSGFFVHVGDIMAQTSQCLEPSYVRAFDIMAELAVPAFIIPGDNEWNDCGDPDSAWLLWETHFTDFEQRFCGTPLVEAQAVRHENFAFVRERVLFIGLNLVGGTVHDSAEWDLRMQDDADWIEHHFAEKGAQVRSAVVFGHAARSGSRDLFFDRFDTAALAFARPILYIHGDGHSWIHSTGWGVPNVERIQIEQNDPPLEVTVTPNAGGPFVFERDPWPPGTALLNQPPCVDAGSDQVVMLGESAPLDGFVTDDGVPTPPAIAAGWSQVSGPGQAQAVVADPGSPVTSASFPQAGSYVLRLTADDGGLAASDDLAIYVDSGQPSLWIRDASVVEGSSGTATAAFTVDLLSATGGLVSVDYQTADATALAGEDYLATSGSLAFSGATDSRTVNVAVIGDGDLEEFETFLVLLGNPSGAAIGDGSATGLILDDDIPRPPAVTSFAPARGTRGSVVTVTGQLANVSAVALGGVAADFSLLSDTQLELVVPATAHSGPISVTNAGGTTQSPTSFGVEFPLSVGAIGSGSVSLAPAGGLYLEGETVTLTPLPASGWEFFLWGGDIGGIDAPALIQILDETFVTAAFIQEGSAIRVPHGIVISGGSDDVEEAVSGGAMKLGSSDLELGVDGGSAQTVGLRFTGLGIPQDARILSASVQFTADEVRGGPAALTVWGEAADDAAAFTSTAGNLSGRAPTSVSVAWSPPDWTGVGDAGAVQRTPDLSALVEEIVGRPGWAPGNALVLALNGSGTRTAEAYEGLPSGAARLDVVEVIDLAPPETPGNLRSPGQTETSIDLVWDAAYDNLGVTGYRLYRLSGPINLPGTSYTETGLAPDAKYAFQVTALDAAGHESLPSPVLRVRTARPDRERPTTPENLRSPSQTETSIDLAWDAATDDVGVVSYRVYRQSGPADVAGTSFTEAGATPGGTYAFQVSARDAAGNESLPGPVLVVRAASPDREPPTAPQNLRSPAQTETRIDLAWDAATDDAGVTGYRVYGPGGPVDVAGTAHTVNGLAADTSYVFQVSALDAAGNESPPSATLGVRTPTPDRESPTTPGNLRSPAQTEASIDLAWDAATDDVGVTGYRIYGPGGSVDVSGTTHSMNGLAAGREYGCQVSALDSAGNESPPSPILVASTLAPDREPPTRPQNLRSPAQTETSIELAWDAATDDVGVTGYRVYGPNGSFDVPGTTHDVNGLAPDTAYAFQVSALDDAGNESLPSSVLLVRTGAPDREPPTTPQNLRSPAQTETSIDLAWDAATDDVGVTGYRVYRQGGPVDVAGTSFTETGLTRGHEYGFQVSALDAAGNESAPSPVLAIRTLAPDVEPPTTPQNLRSPAQTETSIELAWDAATDDVGVTGYRVYGPSGPTDVPGTTHTESGLAADTEYAFQVSALDEAGNESALSPVLLIRTLAPDLPPSTPGNLRSPAQTETSIELAWDAATDDGGVTGYRVYGPSGPVDVPGTTHTEPGLAADTEYGFQVSALDTAGQESPLSPVLLIRTLAPDVEPPTTPQNLRSPARTETSIDLAWDASTDNVGVAGYRIYGPSGPVDVPGTTHAETGLISDTEYAFQISALDEAGNESALSPVLLVRTVTPDLPPSTPGNLRAPAQTETSIDLAWDAATDDVGVTGYRIYGPSGAVDVPGTTHTETGLAPDTEYGFQVSALDTAGQESALSPVLLVRTLAPDVDPPTTPQNLRSPAQTEASIDLAWDASTDDVGVTGYRIYGPSGPVDVPGTTHSETGLAPNTAYDFQVSALDAAGNESALSPVLSVSTLDRVPVAFGSAVANGDDDAEENLNSGSVNLTSSDLELAVTGTTPQAVGLRFTGVEIPQGAPILSASVQFTVDEVSGGAVALSIRGEAADDAAPFATTAGDVSARPATSASLPWSPPDWTAVGDAGAAQRTTDLSLLVQEIVDRPGWAAGNALVLVVTGTGKRTAEAYDGVASAAARLEVVYLGEPDREAPSVPGNLGSPAQTETSIDLAWDAATDNVGVSGYRVYGPSGPVDVPGTTHTETGLASDTEYAFQVSALDEAGNESAPSPVLLVRTAAPDTEAPTTPQNLRSPDQTGSRIDLAWDASTDNVGVTGYRVYGPSGPVDVPGTTHTETGLAPLTAYDFQVSALDEAGNESALSPVLSVSTTATETLVLQLTTGNDDAEENLTSGSVNRTSSDLELAVVGTRPQAVGLRFASVDIPQGASIVSASVQFTVDEVSGGPIALSIRGEAADDAAPFATTAGDVSGRPATSASLPWSPADWTAVADAGAAQRTPDLSVVLQEIVDRPGWAAGNALVLVVTGSGTRTAEAYDGVASAAPVLDVEYQVGP